MTRIHLRPVARRAGALEDARFIPTTRLKEATTEPMRTESADRKPEQDYIVDVKEMLRHQGAVDYEDVVNGNFVHRDKMATRIMKTVNVTMIEPGQAAYASMPSVPVRRRPGARTKPGSQRR